MNFSTNFQKSSNIKFHKSWPVGAQLFHADRQTDGYDEVLFAFRNFAKAPNKSATRLVGKGSLQMAEFGLYMLGFGSKFLLISVLYFEDCDLH